MTSKRIVIIIAALAVTVGMGFAASEFASAQGRGWGMGPGFYGGGPGSGACIGGGPGFGPRSGRGGFGPRFGRSFSSGPVISQALALKDELKLNADQVKKLEQLRTEFYQKAAKERIEMQTLRIEFQKLQLADKTDVAAAEKLIRAMEKKRTDLRVDRLKTIEQGKAVLTAEQLKQLENYSFGPRFGRGGFGPGWHMSQGYGRGWGMGPGYGMMGPGYGRGGWGMMGPGYGPGMMGPGYGPGTMGPGYGRGGWGMMGQGWEGNEAQPSTPPTIQQ